MTILGLFSNMLRDRHKINHKFQRMIECNIKWKSCCLKSGMLSVTSIQNMSFEFKVLSKKTKQNSLTYLDKRCVCPDTHLLSKYVKLCYIVILDKTLNSNWTQSSCVWLRWKVAFWNSNNRIFISYLTFNHPVKLITDYRSVSEHFAEKT